jgi:hypothetical protein
MTSTDVAAKLDTSVRTVQRLAKSGKLPVAHKRPGPNGALLFSRQVVELIASQKGGTNGNGSN